MHKLCTLKDINPGEVVEVPVGLRRVEGEKAIFLGSTCNKKQIFPVLYRQSKDSLDRIDTLALAEDTEFALVQDETFQKASVDAFLTNKLRLPKQGMSMGCDPEIFVTRGSGEVFPAWEYMPDEPTALKAAKEWLTTRWAYNGAQYQANWDQTTENLCPLKVPSYWDGAQAEFAPWAKHCLETLHYGTRAGLADVLQFARAKDPQAKLTLQNVVTLPDTVLKEADDKFIQFRCSQSYNIYNDPGDGIPDAREYKYRCAGGHIHLGFTYKFTAPGIDQIIKGLDAILGVIGVSLAIGIDNPERRKSYGRAGEFRLPLHGIEYRVLSNFWLCHPAIAMLVFELARSVTYFAQSGLYRLGWVAEEQETREVINNCDVEGARQILNRNLPILKGLLQQTFFPKPGLPAFAIAPMREKAIVAILNGVGAVVKDPFLIEQNWLLDRPNDWLYYCKTKGASWQTFATEL